MPDPWPWVAGAALGFLLWLLGSLAVGWAIERLMPDDFDEE